MTLRSDLLRLALAALSVSATAQAADAPQPLTAARGADASEAESTLLGVIAYDGSFAYRARLDLAAPVDLAAFHVALPSFCGNVEILEAGTITEGIEDLAALSRSGTNDFLVNDGHGQRVSAVFVTLNGPADARCTIPIFAGEGGDTDPTEGCVTKVWGTTTLASTSYPRSPLWSEATTRSFIDQAAWSGGLDVAVAADQNQFLLSQPSGACHSYVALRYDTAACGNFDIDAYQGLLVGQTRDGTSVTRLFGFVSSADRWNVCVQFRGQSVIFRRTGL
jgi:hypothetical protein